MRWGGRSCARQWSVRRRSGVRLEDRGDPNAGPAVHDRSDRGEQYGPRTRSHRHLQRLLGTHGRWEDGGWTSQRDHEGHRTRR